MSRSRIAVDARVKALSPEAKACRGLGHIMRDDLYPVTATKRAELRKKGLIGFERRCRRCTYKYVMKFDRRSLRRRGSTSPKYPDGYKMPEGTGRLSREDALIAYLLDRPDLL